MNGDRVPDTHPHSGEVKGDLESVSRTGAKRMPRKMRTDHPVGRVLGSQMGAARRRSSPRCLATGENMAPVVHARGGGDSIVSNPPSQTGCGAWWVSHLRQAASCFGLRLTWSGPEYAGRQ